MHDDDDLWIETGRRLLARVRPRPAEDPQPVTFSGDDADDLAWVLHDAIALPAVRERLRQAEATLESARAAFAEAKARGKDPAAAACRALGLIRDEIGKSGRKKRGFSYDRAAILADWDRLRASRVLRGVVIEPGLSVPDAIAELTLRYSFPRKSDCIKFLRRLRDEIETTHGQEVARAFLDDLPGDPTGI